MIIEWSPEEIEILKEIWKKPGTLKQLIGALPGRTASGAAQYGTKIGLPPRGKLSRARYSWVDDLICRQLQRGVALSAKQLAEAIHCNPNQAWRVLKRGHGTKFYVDSWARTDFKGPWTAKWLAGEEDDAPQPRKKTSTERRRKFDLRKRLIASSGNPFAVAMNQVMQEAA